MNQALKELTLNLQQACASKNWDQLKLIDEQIKNKLQEMSLSAKTTLEKELVASELKKIQNIYVKIIEVSEQHQFEIASELKKISKDRNAANSYLGVSQY